MSEFIHLHNHSHYSLQDGAFQIEDLVYGAVKNKMSAVALTEHGNMFSTVQFYKAAKKEGIKPIIGMEAYVSAGGNRFSRPPLTNSDGRKRSKAYNHLVLLAKNSTGYYNLCKLSSFGYLEGFYYRPRIDLELLNKYKEGLICLTACPIGVVAAQLVKGDMNTARETAITYKEIFGEDLYLEIQNHGLEKEKYILEGMPILSKELGIKLVATNDCHYLKQEHAIPHNVLLHISDARGSIDYKQLRYETDQLYFKSSEEMIKLFKDFPEAITSTLEIADKCNVDIDLQTHYFPKFPIPDENENLDTYLTKLTYEGLKKKIPDYDDKIKERIEYELSVIKKMGYSGYFLIVQDFIAAAKRMNIAVGPGRGSAAGSLVSYSLDITDINPLDYDLLFERFLNPERVSLPDIDCDFADDKRDKIIEYVKEKYGDENVVQIITFSKLTSKAILKDVGRVLGMSIPEVERITKFIPSEFGKVYNIQRALSEVPELKFIKETPDTKTRELIEYSTVLENMSRNVSVHAAGVVISPVPLIEKIPLYYTEETGLISQYDMKDIESIGLIKMDFLGLRTLTIIQDTLDLIKANHNKEIDINKIPFDDEKTYELFGQGKTVGVFQFDKQHTQDYLRRLKPRSIAELSAMNALNRPGPMQFIPEFIDRKHGRKKVVYLHPKLESLLKETYGIIVYQEQVIKIANEVIGYSLAQADILRRAMGKKDTAMMTKMEEEFIKKGMQNGIDQKTCEDIFKEIKSFAHYGFNKSHSVAYSVLAYQTAYLKAHFPVEFLTANLMNNINKTEEITLYINECGKLAIPILPPDINESDVNFKIENKDSIRFGMAAIKNVGESAVKAIIDARKEKKIVSLYDFCAKVDTRVVNKRAIESLIYAGAFDRIHPNRAELLNSVEQALNWGQNEKANQMIGQSSIFEIHTENKQAHEPIIKKIKDWDIQEKLKKEREVLGFFCSSHPLSVYDLEVRSFSTISFLGYELFDAEKTVYTCSIILEVEAKIYQKVKTYARFKLIDNMGECDAIMFDDEYKKYKHLLQEYKCVIVKGLASVRGDKLQIKVNEIIPIEEGLTTLGKGILIDLPVNDQTIKNLTEIKKICSKNTGDMPLIVNLSYTDGNQVQYKLKNSYIKISRDLINEFYKIIPKDNLIILR